MENKRLSNLTQDEQAYINSKEFIEKFGDWKKAQRLEKLKSAEPIVTDGKVFLDGEEISAEIETLRLEGNSKILKILAQNIGNTIKGTYTNLDTKEEFYVGTKTFKEIRRHNTLDEEHIAAIAYIPEIIKKGIYIDKSANENTERYPDVKEWQYFVAGIKINSEDYTVKAAIRVDLDNNKYYDQHLSHIEKGKLLDIINEKNKLVAVNPVNTQDSNELNENTKSNTLSQNTKTADMLENILSNIDDKRLIYICQVPQLPYLDENLEPTKETIQAVREGKLYFVAENQVERIVNTTITPEQNRGQEKITGVRHTLEGSTSLSQNSKGNTAVAISDVNDNSNMAQNENLSNNKEKTKEMKERAVRQSLRDKSRRRERKNMEKAKGEKDIIEIESIEQRHSWYHDIIRGKDNRVIGREERKHEGFRVYVKPGGRLAKAIERKFEGEEMPEDIKFFVTFEHENGGLVPDGVGAEAESVEPKMDYVHFPSAAILLSDEEKSMIKDKIRDEFGVREAEGFESPYKKGRKSDLIRCNENGKLIYKGSARDDDIHETYINYGDNGKVQEIRTFGKGVFEFEERFYDKNDRITGKFLTTVVNDHAVKDQHLEYVYSEAGRLESIKYREYDENGQKKETEKKIARSGRDRISEIKERAVSATRRFSGAEAEKKRKEPPAKTAPAKNELSPER